MNYQELSPKERISTSIRINDRMKKGTPAYEVLDDICSFTRPIVVDFNNVLASNMSPIEINPEAPAFLAQLRDIGDVFIITTAQDWKGVHQILRNGGAWSPNQVLMTMPNWEFITQYDEQNPKGKEIRAAYIELAQSVGLIKPDFDDRDLVTPPGYKPVAPIFGKPFEVPLIDDSRLATSRNPGIRGFCVKSFEPQRTWTEREEGKLTLSEAVQAVRQVYP